MAANPINWMPNMIGGPMTPPPKGGYQTNLPAGDQSLANAITGQAMGGDPYSQFMNWLSGGSAQGAGNTLSGGIGDAANTIRNATAEAKAQLQPYAQGGLQDYNSYRDKVNSGYYNTPFQGTYQAPTMQTQAFNPTYDRASGTYKNNYTPWQAPQQAQISQPGLPQFKPNPQSYISAPPPQGQSSQASGGMNPQMMALLSQMLQRNNQVPNSGVPTSPVASLMPTQTGAIPAPRTAQAMNSNPIQDYIRRLTGSGAQTSPAITMQDIMSKIGIGKTGPYGLQGMNGIGGQNGYV